MGDLFDGYGPDGDNPLSHAFDEVVAPITGTRPQYRDVVSAIAQLDPEDLSARATRLQRVRALNATHDTLVSVKITRTM